jgi:hypothetical protein
LQASNSVEGFMSGDFSQGGWAAFTALTTQPQNNVYGAYIQAESEMSASIARQGANIQADLTMGSGFMSWEKCTKIYEYHQDDAADSGYGQQLVETTPDARIKSGKDGMTTIESCHRETPGSVIGSSLNKQLGIPADSLNMADEINEIISALFSQLVVQVLNGGLYSSTNAPYVRRNSPIGNPDSALGRIRGQSGRDFEATQVDLLRDARRVASTTAAVLPIRKEAFEIVDAERNSYLALISCFEQTGATTTQGYERLTRILEEEIDPFHADLKESYEAAEEGVAVLQQIVIAIESAESTTDLIEPSMEYSRVIRGTRLTSPIALQSAKEDLRKAKNKTRVTDEVVNWRSRLNEYKDQCTLPAPATTTP